MQPTELEKPGSFLAALVDAPTRPLVHHADSQSRKRERRNIAACSAAQVGDESHP